MMISRSRIETPQPDENTPQKETDPSSIPITLRSVQYYDLDAINALITRAIDTWNLPERVKRVSIPVYLYHETDLDFLQLIVAVDKRDSIIGVAAWEPADRDDCPEGKNGLLLHGIYIEPVLHHSGIGTLLLDAVLMANWLYGLLAN